MRNYELDKINKTVTESNIHLCQYCGKEVDRRRIFCDEHNTDLNKQIYEFFVDLPIRPRGAKMFDILVSYLGTKLGVLNDRRIILKSITSAGKSYLMDMIAYLELTHFPGSETVIGSVSDSVSKEHVIRLRDWISGSLFSKYISGSRDATASKTEIHLAHLNSRVISIPQAEKTRCVSSDTEVLTFKGWQKISILHENDIVLTWNKDDDSLEWQSCTFAGTFHYSGKMIRFLNNRSIEMLVTPNHRMVYKNSRDWLVKQANELKKQKAFKIPLAAANGVTSIIPKFYTVRGEKYEIKNFLRFLGYFVSEGNVYKNRIQISQSPKSESFRKIQACISDLGFPIRYAYSSMLFRFTERNLARWLEEKCGKVSGNKKVPEFIFGLDKSLITIFLETYIEGDGDKKTLNSSTKSSLLADQTQALWFLIGKTATIHPHKNRNIHEVCSNLCFAQGIAKSNDASLEDYDGEITCIEVPNSFLVYRYKKKITISGNTGWHPTLLLIDEIGRMKADSYWGSFYQMGKTRAIEILASTPYLDSIVMQDIWNSDGIKQVALTPEDCWWVDRRILTQAKKDLPPNLYSQLYEAKFRTISNRVIPDDLFLESIASGAHMQQSQNLLMGVDFGQKIDPTAVIVIDLETGDIKFAMQFDDAWKIQFAKIRQIYNEWKPIKIMADSSSIGSVIISELSDLPIEGVSMHNDILKKRVIDRLTMAFINHKVNIVADEFPLLVSQLSSYVYLDQDHKKMGPSGRGHDDFVDALGLALMAFDVSSVSDMKQVDNIWTFTRVPGSSASPWKIGGF